MAVAGGHGRCAAVCCAETVDPPPSAATAVPSEWFRWTVAEPPPATEFHVGHPAPPRKFAHAYYYLSRYLISCAAPGPDRRHAPHRAAAPELVAGPEPTRHGAGPDDADSTGPGVIVQAAAPLIPMGSGIAGPRRPQPARTASSLIDE
ncbi:hypothetical protein GCM10010442_34180 [Kitasatospora kifunensis]